MRLQQLLNDALEAALRFWTAGVKTVKTHDPSQRLGPAKVVRQNLRRRPARLARNPVPRPGKLARQFRSNRV
jgi:hypothetical protein